MTDNTKPLPALSILAAFLILAYLLPYHVYPFLTFYNEWLTFLGVAIVLALFSQQKNLAIQVPWLVIIPFGLAIVIGLQMLFGLLIFSWYAVFPIAYFICAALALILGATITAQPQGSLELSRALAYAHWFAGLISVVIATLQLAGKETLILPFAMPMAHDVAIRPYANIGQPNQLALLFCLAIASTWWLYQASRLRPIIAVGSTLLLLWGLAITQSRIGWIIIPLFTLFAWLWRNNPDFKRIPASLTTALSLGYFSLVAVLPSISDAFLDATTVSATEHISNGSVRWELFNQALRISLDHPWFGAGWYEFGPQQVQIAAGFNSSVYARHAHNIVLNLAAEVGWPVTIMVFTALTYWFYKCCLRRNQQKPLSIQTGFAILFFVAVFVHSLVEFPLWYAYVLIPLAFLLGMVHQEQLGANTIQLSRTYTLTLFLIMILGLLAVANDYRRMVTGFRAFGWEGLGLKADEGSSVKPDFTLFPEFYDYFQFTKILAHPGMSPEQIDFMERMTERFGHPPMMLRMSLIYTLNGRSDEAVRTMMTLMKLHEWHYPEAYKAWTNMANAEPDKYAIVFKQLAHPAKL